MTNQKKTNRIYTCVVLLLLLLAVAIRGGLLTNIRKAEKAPDTLSLIKQVYPEAQSYRQHSNRSVTIYDKSKKVITNALLSSSFKTSAQGYGGPVPLLISFDSQQKITGVSLLSNQESPDYLDHMYRQGLLKHWNQLPLDSNLVTTKVDAVSGATFTSTAVIQTVQKTAAAYLHTAQQNRISASALIQTILTILLILISLGMVRSAKFRKYYWWYLLVIFIVFGLWRKQMLSTALLHVWLTKGISIHGNSALIIILILAIAMALLGHRKYYCTYLCPMGAIQILAGKISPFKKSKFNFKISVLKFRTIYLFFITAGLILGFTLPLSDMEPFSAFSWTVASWIMIAAGILIVVLSLFFTRPWCQICPTGCLLDTVPSFKQKSKK